MIQRWQRGWMVVVCYALLAGCTTFTGEPGYDYVRGRSVALYPRPFETVWREALALVQAERIRLSQQQRTEGEGELRGVRPDGKNIYMYMVVRGSQRTTVQISVGSIDDRYGAEALQRALAKRLGVASPV